MDFVINTSEPVEVSRIGALYANHIMPCYRAGAYTASDNALREKSGLAT